MSEEKPKLKTLKDIEYHNVDISCGKIIAKRTSCVETENLRQVAIEWMKHYKKIREKHSKVMMNYLRKEDNEGISRSFSYDLDVSITLDFITKFCDLTEEDINGK